MEGELNISADRHEILRPYLKFGLYYPFWPSHGLPKSTAGGALYCKHLANGSNS